jgi:Domain of unknown function (DUF4328)
VTDPIAPPTPPVVSVAKPARIGALRAAGAVTATLLAVVLVASVAEMVMTPSAVADPNGPIAIAEVGLSLVRVVAMLGTAVAVMFWLYIAAENVQTWGIRLKWGPGWAIGGWFLPVANLVIPVLVVHELAKESASAVSPPWARQRAGTGLIVVWWVTFLLGTAFIRASAQKRFPPDEADYALGYVLPGTVCFVAAAVLGMLVVRHITVLQVRRQAALDVLTQLTPGSV